MIYDPLKAHFESPGLKKPGSWQYATFTLAYGYGA